VSSRYPQDHADVSYQIQPFGCLASHPAALNLGDCLTYAVGRVAREPLLCLGNDFARTDLSPVEV
jgi:ribonuclease VapC